MRKIMGERLAKDPYYRAGAFGMVFCLGGILFTDRPIFLLGIGFFAALFSSSIYSHWKIIRREEQMKDLRPVPDDGKIIVLVDKTIGHGNRHN